MAASSATLLATQADSTPTPRRHTFTAQNRDERHTGARYDKRRVVRLERLNPSPSYALPEAPCERNDVSKAIDLRSKGV